MSLCKRLECAACKAWIEDTAPEIRSTTDGRLLSPNLGVDACHKFLTAHMGHAGVRALVWADDLTTPRWVWDRPSVARLSDFKGGGGGR